MTPTGNSSLWSGEDSHSVILSSAEGICSAKCIPLSSGAVEKVTFSGFIAF